MGDGEIGLGAVDGTAVLVGVSASGGPMNVAEDGCFLEIVVAAVGFWRVHRASWRDKHLVPLHGLE